MIQNAISERDGVSVNRGNRPVNWLNAIVALLICLFIVPGLCAVLFKVTPVGAATTPDSVSYFDTATNIAEGNGIVRLNISLSSKSQFIPTTGWPPLYPILLSIFLDDDRSPVFVARNVNYGLLTLSTILIFLTTSRHVGIVGGLLVAILFVAQVPILSVHIYAWSEPLFIFLTLSAYLLMT